MHLEFTLPPPQDINLNNGCISLNNPQANDQALYVNAVGYAIINEIKLKLKNETIDKHSGLWMDIWNELTDPNKNEWPLVGKYESDNNRFLTGTKDNKLSRYYLPLKFFFCRNTGLAIPYFLLTDNDLKIEISLNSLNSLLLYNGNNINLTQRSIINFSIHTEYIFLEPEEENKILNNLPNEYLVEVVDEKTNLSINNSNGIIFTNPTKELIWVFRNSNRIATENVSTNGFRYNIPGSIDANTSTNGNDIFNYSYHTQNTTLNYNTFDPFSTLQIKIDGRERIEDTEATFFRTIQPYKYHSKIPGGYERDDKKRYIYTYSFALNPEDYQPSGSYNFSINDDSLDLVFTAPQDGLANYTLNVFSYHYKYLSFDQNTVTFSDVPIQSFMESLSEGDPCAQRQSNNKKDKAVKEEIKRRYAVEVPYVHDQSLGKKQWSGLQGNFFQTQKHKDLGKNIDKIKNYKLNYKL